MPSVFSGTQRTLHPGMLLSENRSGFRADAAGRAGASAQKEKARSGCSGPFEGNTSGRRRIASPCYRSITYRLQCEQRDGCRCGQCRDRSVRDRSCGPVQLRSDDTCASCSASVQCSWSYSSFRSAGCLGSTRLRFLKLNICLSPRFKNRQRRMTPMRLTQGKLLIGAYFLNKCII